MLLNLPLDVQAAEVPAGADRLPPAPDEAAASTDPEGAARLAAALASADRPVFVVGRGGRGRGCREALETLAERCGALLATSAVANGLFHGNPWSLGISGGFASPLTAELIRGADLIVGWGCALNMWTMSHGTLIGPDATVVQVDIEPDALGRNRTITFGVIGDVAATAVGVRRRSSPGGTTTATARLTSGDGSLPERAGATSPSRIAPPPTASTRASSVPPSTTPCRRNGSWPRTRATSRAIRRHTCPSPTSTASA